LELELEVEVRPKAQFHPLDSGLLSLLGIVWKTTEHSER
jgi:hypothetical protein